MSRRPVPAVRRGAERAAAATPWAGGRAGEQGQLDTDRPKAYKERAIESVRTAPIWRWCVDIPFTCIAAFGLMTHLLRTSACSVLVMLLSTPVQAHPGHGVTETGAWHYLGEPVHAVWLAAPVILAGLATLTLAARRRGSAERG